MKWTYLLGAAPGLLALLSGCTPAETPQPGAQVVIKTTAYPYQGPPQRLLILATLGSEFDQNASDQFKDLAQTKLAACGVTAQFAVDNPALDITAVPLAYAAFSPDAVLRIRLTMDKSVNGNSIYKDTVTDLKTGKMVWTGDATVTPGQNVGETYNRLLVDQLIIDHILPQNCLVPTPLHP